MLLIYLLLYFLYLIYKDKDISFFWYRNIFIKVKCKYGEFFIDFCYFVVCILFVENLYL